MTRDLHRQRVYDAEEAAFGGTHLAERLSWPDVEATFHAVVHHAWWLAIGATQPVLRTARVDSLRSSADGREIRIAEGGRNALTIAHELAHHLVACTTAGAEPAHGPRFCAALIRLVQLVGGVPARRRLEAELARREVPVGPWWSSEPPGSVALAATLVHAAPERLRGAVALPAVPGRTSPDG